MKVLIDTCVILDAIQSREPFRKDAENIFYKASEEIFEGYITSKSFLDLYYTLHKDTHSDFNTRKILSSLLKIFYLLDTNSIECINALSSNIKDYEDAVMIETTYKNKIDYIVTRNIKDYKKSIVNCITPKELLNLLK